MKRHKAGILLLGLTLAMPLVSCSDASRPDATSNPSEKSSPATPGSVVGTGVRRPGEDRGPAQAPPT
ncbi:exported hypothetical protein [Arthrobacter sp. 9V]|uniref:hypothetical protein n=1 Tax=Arthrobacter sp. 9V TaxID=2653132 RepID=UPI0012F2268F|nr:hypothetical protein [Arthrobacter sp. 9V]VXC28834.1 exported hypothetical protein [Arthrobacter sp. 9V]